jgi:Septin
VEIEITKAELEEKFFSVRLTIVDTPGFGDYVNSKEAWAPIVEFLDDQVMIAPLTILSIPLGTPHPSEKRSDARCPA